MSERPIHDLRSKEPGEAIRSLKEILAEGDKPIGLRLDNRLAVVGVVSLLERRGWQAQKYQAGNDHLVLGSPPGVPPLTVWYGHGGWKLRRGDDESRLNAPEPMAILMSEVRPEGAGGEEAETERRAEALANAAVIIVNGDSMGYGDSELGLKLLLTYFDILTAMAAPPEVIFFHSNAARLTAQSSALLPAIKELALQGARILTCSVCLDHLHLGDQLQVGRKSNMYELVNLISTYGKVVYL